MADPGQNDVRKLDDENRRLRAAVEELSILNDIATTISSAYTIDQIIDLIVQKCIKHLRVEQGAVMLLDSKEATSEFKTMVRKANSSHEVLPFRLDAQLAGWMITHKEPLLINELGKDERFTLGKGEDMPYRSLLSVPLCLKGRIVGAINVFNKRADEGFTDADKRLLTIIATQSAQVIENARLSEEELALQLMQEEMRLAYKIQMDLLPKNPVVQGYDIAGRSIPAKTVGGDYFDFLETGPNCLCICLGDVSGKGMPAALLMSNLQATLRGQAMQDCIPDNCIKKSNMLLYRSTTTDKFATLFYGMLNTEEHKLCYCNAGHNWPFLFKANGETLRLDVGGPVLGIIEDFDYGGDSVQLDPGDLLVIFSDGITEAIDERETMFDEENLEAVIRENMANSSVEIVDNIIDSVEEHAASTAQMDDMTLVVLKRNPS
jgi:sigma-B regulation protein RsbU (phosphoserine phosphatase)